MHFNPVWLVALLPLMFPLIWVMVIALVAQLSGWAGLAARYPANDFVPTNLSGMQFARVGMAAYKGCMTVGITPSGLYLVPMFIFKPFHPPLLIPWHAIRAEHFKRFLMDEWRLTIAETGTQITILDGLYEKMKPYLSQKQT